jgi:CubicO group peptidase (beta-lactamase class C family)
VQSSGLADQTGTSVVTPGNVRVSYDLDVNLEACIGEIDELHQSIDNADHPGGVVVVTHGGRILIARTYGAAMLESATPWTLETRYWIASITKTFTAQLVLLLVDDGLIDLQADVRERFAELAHLDGPLTVEHLLTMRSGMMLEEGLLDLLDFAGEATDDYLRTVSGMQRRLLFPPGRGQSYSCANFRYLARLVELVTGNTYAHELRQRIFEPLELTDTGVAHDPRTVVRNMAPLYLRGSDPDSWYVDPGRIETSGDGAIYSTASDLTRWMLASRGSGSSTLPGFDVLGGFAAPVGDESLGYGAGIFSSLVAPVPTWYHGGVTNTIFVHAPGPDIGVIGLYNSYRYDAEGNADQLLRVVCRHLGVAVPEPSIPVRRADASEVIGDWVDASQSWVARCGETTDGDVGIHLMGRTLRPFQTDRRGYWQLRAFGKVEGFAQFDGDTLSLSFGRGRFDLQRLRQPAHSPRRTTIAGRYRHRELGIEATLGCVGDDLWWSTMPNGTSEPRCKLELSGPSIWSSPRFQLRTPTDDEVVLTTLRVGDVHFERVESTVS